MEKTMEQAQLLARFKLQVKRTLGESVNLDSLSNDPIYAKARLAEIEEMAEDEELLIMVLRVRDLVLPAEPMVAAPAVASPTPAPMPAQKETRNYMMGARAW